MHQIKDGTGTGQLVKVDDTNRMFVRAVSESPAHEAVLSDDHYIVSSTIITLGTANKTSIIFLQNDESKDLFIDKIIVTAGASTDGTEDFFMLSGTRNPTGMANGSGNSAIVTNSNFGTTNLLSETSEYGQDTATTTGGAVIFAANFEIKRTAFIEQRLLLETGNTVAFEITAPPSNTNLQVAIGLNCHLVKP